MLDRASTFARPGIVSLLKSELVPVALDQAYERRQKDAEGDFYRRIAAQSPRKDFGNTTQGFYVATASGNLLLYNNNRDPEKIERLLREKLAEFKRSDDASADVAAVAAGTPDPRWNIQPPQGGLVVRVRAKVMEGYEPTDDPWRAIFQSAVSRDNLWISAAEHQSLAHGDFPESLAHRVARFHLVDNTRGEPPMWEPEEVRHVEITIHDGLVTGRFELRTQGGDRSFAGSLRGHFASRNGKLTRLDLVALGDFSGGGPFTPHPPPGTFPLAVSFSLANGLDVADALPPQGARGWLDGYLERARR
ncbi:MAG: hypothetical protein ACKV19_04835 [Verrucomicrobiales bacterium]